ncbi:MAG: helix-turn-helix domain-containing protein, partial [Planctomycetaceae bacterium]|nr:helix-turn-helix domain-containing protein [Planctomycetaceae bacterium]
MPHDVAADPRLTPTDLRVIAALLYYACSKPMCYPSDAGIAERVHKHPGTVRRCLKRIEDLGYIRREFVTATPDNPTGRLIHLTFTEPGWARPTTQRDAPERRRAPVPERRRTSTPCAAAQSPRAQAPVPPRAPAHAEEDVIVETEGEFSGESRVTDSALRSRPATPEEGVAVPEEPMVGPVTAMPPVAAPPAVTPAAMPPVAMSPVAAPPVAGTAAASAAGTIPFDLRVIGYAPELRVPPAPMAPMA